MKRMVLKISAWKAFERKKAPRGVVLSTRLIKCHPPSRTDGSIGSPGTLRREKKGRGIPDMLWKEKEAVRFLLAEDTMH